MHTDYVRGTFVIFILTIHIAPVSLVVYRRKNGKLIKHNLVRKTSKVTILNTTSTDSYVKTTAKKSSLEYITSSTRVHGEKDITSNNNILQTEKVQHRKKENLHEKKDKGNKHKDIKYEENGPIFKGDKNKDWLFDDNNSNLNAEFSSTNKKEIGKFEKSLRNKDKLSMKQKTPHQLKDASSLKGVIPTKTTKTKYPTMPSRLNLVKVVPEVNENIQAPAALKTHAIRDKYLMKTIGGILAAFTIVAIILAALVVNLSERYMMPSDDFVYRKLSREEYNKKNPVRVYKDNVEK